MPEPEYPYNSFCDCEIREKSILIVEPHASHGEVLPGLAKYFQDLGFDVDLFVRTRNVLANPFCDYPQGRLPRFFPGNREQIKKLLRSEKTINYEYIFFSSSFYGEKYIFGFGGFYLKYLGFRPKARKGLLFIEHGLSDFEKYYAKEWLKEGRLFTLWPFFDDVPFLNPHYFGEKRAAVNKNAKTRFIFVGGDKYRFNLVIEAVEKLLSLENKNFAITVIAERIQLPKIPEGLAQYIKFKGSLNFAAMFEEIRASDFFLLPLSYSVKRHHTFLRGQVSGTNQLMLGFGKPCLLEETFANAYGLTEKNAVIYNDGRDLCAAMRRDMAMSQGEYGQMRENLQILADELYAKSLGNLRKALQATEEEN
jgi:hypothetical protein